MVETDVTGQIKAANAIQDVITEMGYPLGGHGRYRRSGVHDSLIVDTQKQYYDWNSKGETGDVFTWLEKRNNWDFKQAAEFLAKRCGMPAPVWSKEDQIVREEKKKTSDVLDAATAVFERWLWTDEQALAYARSRWSDETIKAAHIGYSGKHDKINELAKELRDELKSAGADIDSPAAVSLVGATGDVQGWMIKHKIEIEKRWVDNQRIPGMVGKDMIIYPHFDGSKIVYYSGRYLHPFDKRKNDNPPVCLVGSKKVYQCVGWHNQKTNARVICEGPADAITLWHEWGIPSMALMGVAGDATFFKNKKSEFNFYIGLDADAAGERNFDKIAEMIGPMARLIKWGELNLKAYKDGIEVPAKDANEIFQAMRAKEIPQERQIELVEGLMHEARTYVEATALKVGGLQGAEREKAQKDTIALMTRMDEEDLSLKRTEISKLLDLSVRDVDRMIKTYERKQRKTTTEEAPKKIYGGYIGGHLIEYLWDPETGVATFAWRDPDGAVHTGDQIKIGETVYAPVQDDEIIKMGGVLFPSQLGQLKSTRELATYLEMFVKSIYLLPSQSEAKIISYYILLTWVYDAFQAIPYLRVMGEPGSGKSELMKRVALVCYRRIIANGCSTTASLFHIVQQYKGTVYLDEMDMWDSNASVDIIKFLNLGAMRDGMVTRMMEGTDEEGNKIFKPQMFETFCPKLLSMQKDFQDTAVGTRCLTFKLQPRETIELVNKGIPLNITPEIEKQALVLRNMLTAWKLAHWQRNIDVKTEFLDFEISSRLNQVTGPLLAIAKDDPELQTEIRSFLRAYYQEMVLTRSMTITARVIEALWKIHKYPDLRETMVTLDPKTDEEKILVGHITQIANQIIDEMNMGDADGEEEGEEAEHKKRKKKEKELSPQKIGRLIRDDLQLRVSERTNKGYSVFWDDVRMIALAKRHGINPAEIAGGSKTPIQPPTNKNDSGEEKKEKSTLQTQIQPGFEV